MRTNIKGLILHRREIVGDRRGVLSELAPGGLSRPPFARLGVRHIYVSVATEKKVLRGEHYHHKNHEFFFIMTGACLLICHDFRERSGTFDKTWAAVISFKPYEKKVGGVKNYSFIKNDFFAVEVPIGVWHAFVPLTDEPVQILAFSSLKKYEPEDYVKIKAADIPAVKKILQKLR